MSAIEWIPIALPDLGTDSVQVVQWLIDPPSEVVAGDRILELLADGVLFHLAAEASGHLVRQDCHRGSRVTIGESLGWIEPTADTESSWLR